LALPKQIRKTKRKRERKKERKRKKQTNKDLPSSFDMHTATNSLISG
jgi:hypothetical protein